MATLVAICKGKDDFHVESFEVSEMDARRSAGRSIRTSVGPSTGAISRSSASPTARGFGS